MNVTSLELQVVKAFIFTSVECCGNFAYDDNLSYCNDRDIAEMTGLTRHQVAALFGSLSNKGLIVDTEGSARRAKCNDYVADPENCLAIPELAEYINSLF